MTKAIYFDMDGTIANLYGVENWLEKIINEDASLYTEALPLVKMNVLARLLNKLQKNGYIIGIVSWLAKNSTENYDLEVTKAKINWLKSHLASVNFDEIKIVPYGTPKEKIVNFPNGILFDDETPNRENWIGKAFDETEILTVLKAL
jgi:hypothetical protein